MLTGFRCQGLDLMWTVPIPGPMCTGVVGGGELGSAGDVLCEVEVKGAVRPTTEVSMRPRVLWCRGLGAVVVPGCSGAKVV